MIKGLCASMLESSPIQEQPHIDSQTPMEFEMGGESVEQQQATEVSNLEAAEKKPQERRTPTAKSPSHRKIRSANVTKVVLSRIKKLGMNSGDKKMKKQTLKASWRLRNKIFTEKENKEAKEQVSIEVVITELVQETEPSTREQRASSKKSMKKIVRKLSKGKKKMTVIEVEEIQDDDGITESEMVGTPEELRPARVETVESMEERQTQVQIPAELGVEEEIHLVDEVDNIQGMGISYGSERVDMVEESEDELIEEQLAEAEEITAELS